MQVMYQDSFEEQKQYVVESHYSLHPERSSHTKEDGIYCFLFFFAEIAYADQAISFLFKFRQRESM